MSQFKYLHSHWTSQPAMMGQSAVV
uniref:Uncharacterized protein n=1 Tax=Arundo donax TaxID=35708 RepID=A0A0A9FAW1_ARUDO